MQAPRWVWHRCGGMFERTGRPSASRCKAACLRPSISSRCSVVSMPGGRPVCAAAAAGAATASNPVAAWKHNYFLLIRDGKKDFLQLAARKWIESRDVSPLTDGAWGGVQGRKHAKRVVFPRARTIGAKITSSESAMLEVLFDDDDSSGSDDVEVPNGGRAGPLPNAQLAGSQPQWQQTVADELTALHAALETRARALNEREAALTERETRVSRRETQLASDDGLLRAVLEKESSRLLADAQVPASTLPQAWPRCCLRRGNHAPYPHGSTQLGLAKPNPKPNPWQARLDTAAGLQVQRLEATVATLRSQCRQLQLASGQPTPALRPRAGRPVTPSRGRRKSVEQWSSPSIAPCEAPRGTAAAAAARMSRVRLRRG